MEYLMMMGFIAVGVIATICFTVYKVVEMIVQAGCF